MTSTYTTDLRFTKQGTGDNSGTWGTVANNVFDLIEESIAGFVSINVNATTGNYNLSTANGATDEARRMILRLGGSPATARNVVIPAVSKLYAVECTVGTAVTITVKTNSGIGVNFVAGQKAVIYCDGLNTYSVNPQLTDLAVTATAAELNILDGATVTVAELNILDGATVTVAELNILDGVTVSAAQINTAAIALPVGAVMPYAGTTAPSLWLLCYGQSLLRASYTALFTAIGTTYGAADGTHFSIPDLRGRAVAGKDDMGGASSNRLTSATTGGIDGDVLGGTGGAETNTLSIANMPLHGHPFVLSNNSAAQSDTTGGLLMDNQQVSVKPAFTSAPTATNGEQIGGTGGGGAHNNVQPTIILNYIIYAGV